MKTQSPFLIKNQNVGKSPIYISFRDFRVVITFVKKYDRFLSVSCRVGDLSLSISCRVGEYFLSVSFCQRIDFRSVVCR